MCFDSSHSLPPSAPLHRVLSQEWRDAELRPGSWLGLKGEGRGPTHMKKVPAPHCGDFELREDLREGNEAHHSTGPQ